MPASICADQREYHALELAFQVRQSERGQSAIFLHVRGRLAGKVLLTFSNIIESGSNGVVEAQNYIARPNDDASVMQ